MTDDTDSKKRHLHHQHHTADPGHTHHNDDHADDADYEGPIEDHPLWQRDNVILTSVGIDIGSAGTQILFSRLHLRRQGANLSSRYMVVSRETWYESPVSLTPYESETLIDARALGALVDDAYHMARIHPEDIDTGVVILTGEALRRDNSERIARILSEKCGELVCVAAGHHMEAMLAAHGSGAVQASYDRNERVLNIDIGGGTTKLGVIEKGTVLATAAIHIGGRLLAINAEGSLERLDPAGQAHARRAGFTWKVGDKVGGTELDKVAESMADDLVATLIQPTPTGDIKSLYLTDPITDMDGIDSMIFSGGVAEFVYAREDRDFGDLGKRLGHALRRRIDAGALPWTLLPDSQGIRATALGASEYSAQLSGNTGYISDPDILLPRRNVQVLHAEFDFTGSFSPADLAEAIRKQLQSFDLVGTESDLVLALHWRGSPDFLRVKGLAEGIIKGLSERIARGKPVYVILDADIAMNLGSILREDFAISNGIMVVDGIALWNFDYIDLGKVRMPSNTVPVMIKSLVFKDVPQGPRRHERVHHQPDAVKT